MPSPRDRFRDTALPQRLPLLLPTQPRLRLPAELAPPRPAGAEVVYLKLPAPSAPGATYPAATAASTVDPALERCPPFRPQRRLRKAALMLTLYLFIPESVEDCHYQAGIVLAALLDTLSARNHAQPPDRFETARRRIQHATNVALAAFRKIA